MAFLKFTSTDKSGNREVRFSYIDGIPDLFTTPEEVVDVTIDRKQNQLILKSALQKNRTASLDLHRITDVRQIDTTYSKEKNAFTFGDAVLTGLIAGPQTTIVAASLLRGKKKIHKTPVKLIVITYTSELSAHIKKRLLLKIEGSSIGWEKFVDELPKDPASPYAPKPAQTNIVL